MFGIAILLNSLPSELAHVPVRPYAVPTNANFSPRESVFNLFRFEKVQFIFVTFVVSKLEISNDVSVEHKLNILQILVMQ